MKRSDLKELHYICHVDNLASILKDGILSHNRVKRLVHKSIADAGIQDRRAKVVVPGAKPLHDYANLYVCARNPMLFKRRNRHHEICVLSIGVDVLDLPGVVITDMNAAAESLYVSFRKAPEGLEIVDEDLTFAEWWNDPDQVQKWRKKSAKCAEVLVPDSVEPRFILGCYISCDKSKMQIQGMTAELEVRVDSHLFFLARKSQ